MIRLTALLLTVLTGFTALVYEVAWQKYLATLLGSHGEATASVLAIFSGGQPTEESLAVRLEADLTAAGVRYSVQTRSELRAGFMDDGRPDVHDAVAEFESWNELLSFFRAELS